jgi:thiamine biosynthesis lipoprotein
MRTTDHSPVRLTRRQLVAIGGGLFLVALMPAAVRRRRQAVTRSIPVMGTVAEVIVVHHDRAEAQAAIDLAFERLLWVDRTMSRFRPDSDIGRTNLGAAQDAVPVHPMTAMVVSEALRWAAATDGAYDPGLARVSELWDVANRSVPPAREAYRRFSGRQFHRHIGVDRFQGEPVLRYDDRDVGLDLGGIAKGYAVDLAIGALRGAGIRDAVVNAGGDLYAMGRSADGDPWRVGVRSAADPSRNERELALTDEAVATSGDYFQGFDFEGRRYHHILDGATAEPRRVRDHSVTVRAPRCLDADAGATAVFGLGPVAAGRLLARVVPEARLG